MKKYNWCLVLCIILLIVICSILLHQKNSEHQKMEELCQTSAYSALEHFRNYQSSGKESDYLKGVAEFRCFMTAYLFLNDNTSNAEYTWCNIIYGSMVLYPETVQQDVQGLIDALEYLSEDYDSVNGFHLINVYSNQLQHGN